MQKDVIVALLQSPVGRQIVLRKVKSRICKLTTVIDAIIAAVAWHNNRTQHANLQSWFAPAEAQNFILCILQGNPERKVASLIRKTLQERKQFPRLILYITSYVLRDDVDYFHSLTLDDSARMGCARTSWSDSFDWFVTHVRTQQKKAPAAPAGAEPAPVSLASGYSHFQEQFANDRRLPPLRALVSCLASRLYHTLIALNEQVTRSKDPQLPQLHCRQWRTLRVLALTLFVLIGNDPASAIALSRREVVLMVTLLRHDGLLSFSGMKACPPSYPKVLCAVICTMMLLAAAILPNPVTESGQVMHQPKTQTAPPPDTAPDADPAAALTALTAQLVGCVPCCEVLTTALVHVHCQEYASVRALVCSNMCWPVSAVGPAFFEPKRFAAYAAAVRSAIAPSTLCRCVHLKTLSIQDGAATGLV